MNSGVLPKFTCRHPNSQHLRCDLTGRWALYRGNQVKTWSLEWTRIQHDWCPYKTGKVGPRHAQRADEGNDGRRLIYKPRRETLNGPSVSLEGTTCKCLDLGFLTSSTVRPSIQFVVLCYHSPGKLIPTSQMPFLINRHRPHFRGCTAEEVYTPRKDSPSSGAKALKCNVTITSHGIFAKGKQR